MQHILHVTLRACDDVSTMMMIYQPYSCSILRWWHPMEKIKLHMVFSLSVRIVFILPSLIFLGLDLLIMFFLGFPMHLKHQHLPLVKKLASSHSNFCHPQPEHSSTIHSHKKRMARNHSYLGWARIARPSLELSNTTSSYSHTCFSTHHYQSILHQIFQDHGPIVAATNHSLHWIGFLLIFLSPSPSVGHSLYYTPQIGGKACMGRFWSILFMFVLLKGRNKKNAMKNQCQQHSLDWYEGGEELPTLPLLKGANKTTSIPNF